MANPNSLTFKPYRIVCCKCAQLVTDFEMDTDHVLLRVRISVFCHNERDMLVLPVSAVARKELIEAFKGGIE